MQETVESGSALGTRLEYKDGGLHIVRSGAGSGGSGGRATKQQVKPAQQKKSPPPSTQSQKDSPSQTKAAIAYRKKEFVAEGNVSIIADPSIEANSVVALLGVGKVMSGNWYVESVRHSWTREGYSMELEVKSNVAGGMKPNPVTRKPPATPKKAPTKNYTVKPGDTLWAIAAKYYGAGTQWRKIWEANKAMLISRDKRNRNTPGHWIYPKQSLVIP